MRRVGPNPGFSFNPQIQNTFKIGYFLPYILLYFVLQYQYRAISQRKKPFFGIIHWYSHEGIINQVTNLFEEGDEKIKKPQNF